ncbi:MULTISPECIES: hypothetical protein [unclassified Novosphingobium]|uniref:hypothetical protein n=1 Tax=unclassified Novosphingobium TaxID=2644732 RepID=UPI001493EB91|nr:MULTISPECIES: hypothetical protein [unclassified Novosphingobium]MBB3651204.1 hypothetical protein [Novosphingobium sp. BK626]MBB3356330.1 hypothetical protein [Novosphingobium sp. BK256]MBB3372731.1 hypothetical protein [Novosphingobium sp. BK280]MBB3377098.1 hypothetical protein [Novosphingobium sp. BK258]MBB3419490.1 hypothetical protein [Novosphingobium sp. BK267]
MKLFPPFFVLALASSTALEAKSPVPSAAELAAAIAMHTKKLVLPADVRPLGCEGFTEEPTEFECRWTQKIHGKWFRYSTYFAIDGADWIIIDWPPSKLK